MDSRDPLNRPAPDGPPAPAVDPRASQRQTEHLAAISHQIRTPLNGVLALADLLAKQPLAGDGPAYVRTIKDSVEHVVSVLSEAIEHYRTECVGLELAPEPVALRPLMDALQALWMVRAQQAGVSLNVSFEGAPDDTVLLDGPRLTQVFGNLIANALRFTRRGGVEARLRVAIHRGQARLTGVVRDTGPGIAGDKLATIFEPFLQDARGERTGETGLGLSICRQIINAMGGRIWAEANSGAGAAFFFEIDVPVAAAFQAVDDQAEAVPALRGHVLIVDDNRMNRMVAEKLCESFGCTSETAADGAEAVEAVRMRRFDVVLMDIRMPGMDGVEATRAIRASTGPERDVPVIALTANADDADARSYVAAGMACVVEKPIKADFLFAALEAALSQQPARSDRDVAAA
jgi:CheY-like chemotaxis protein